MVTYQLAIITPDGSVFDGKVESIIAISETGSFGVLGHHAPMVVAMREGPLTIKQNGSSLFFRVSSGILEVNEQGNTLLLVDYAQKVDTYDQAKTSAAQSANT